jgi:inorganic pyrophosphatase
MLQFVLIALVATAVSAQSPQPKFPSSSSSPQPEVSPSAHPDVQSPSNGLLTGGNQEYVKVVKGDWRFWKGNPVDFRTFIRDASSNKPLSYWHDIPMFFNKEEKIYNMVVEVPRGGAVLTLVNLGEQMNPLTVHMDPETGRPQKENVDYIHNFGHMPQTFHPNVSDERVGEGFSLNGTGNPLDIIEISDRVHQRGDVIPVKILGVLGVVDGETSDYKLIAFDTRAVFASQINTLADVEIHFPDLLAATRGYFRFYKFPEQVNEILFRGEYQNSDWANDLIAEKHQQWLDLITSDNPPAGYALQCHVEGAKQQADDAAWNTIIAS